MAVRVGRAGEAVADADERIGDRAAGDAISDDALDDALRRRGAARVAERADARLPVETASPGRYSLVYQKVQPSNGSTVIVL